MEVEFVKGFERYTGMPILAANFGSDEGECCGEVIACNCAMLDATLLDDEDFNFLSGNQYGYGNRDLPPASIPETGVLCYFDWLVRVKDRWDQLTVDQQNKAFEVANAVYPDANFFVDLSAML